MRAALETPTVGVVTDNGYVMRPGVWSPPAVVTADMQRDAAQAMGALKLRGGPVSPQKAQEWVAHLALRCNGSQLPPETKLAGAVSDILRGGYPAAIFEDDEAFDRIARTFRFWPGWAELSEALDAERSRLRDEWSRLSAIAKGGQPAPRRPAQQDDEPTGPRTMSEATQKLMDEYWAKNGGRPAGRSMVAASDARRMEG